jgi:transcriptional regulator with XRE-family HTH domain
MARSDENDSIGARVKNLRVQMGLTLKALEARAAVSATHVSEIERGKTSPTIGALAKLAGALGKDLSFFLESKPLDELCILRADEQKPRALPWGGGEQVALTRGIPGARLSAHRLRMESGSQSGSRKLSSSMVLWLRSGDSVRVEVESVEHLLQEGDSIHIGANVSHRLTNVGRDRCELYLVGSAREALGGPR